MLGQQPCHQQLVAVGLPQVQAQRRTAIRSLLYRKYDRLPYQVAVLLGRRHLGELRLTLKELLDLRGDFVATGSYRRANARPHIARPGTELLAPRLYRRGRHPPSTAAPPCLREPQHLLYTVAAP